MNGHSPLYHILAQIRRDSVGGRSVNAEDIKPYLNDKITLHSAFAGYYIYCTPIAKVYYVISGSVSIIRSSPDGKNTSRSQKAPAFLGVDYAVLSCRGEALPDIFTTVQAAEDCLFLEIDRAWFLRNIRQDGELCFDVLSEICEKFFYSSFRFDETCFYDPASRLMNYIVNRWLAAGKPEGRYTIRTVNSKIAEEIAVSTRTFYRAAGQLREDGLLAMVSGNICVTQKQLREMSLRLGNLKGEV